MTPEPPEGFELVGQGAATPSPPPGFTLESGAVPPPPPGFVLEAPDTTPTAGTPSQQDKPGGQIAASGQTGVSPPSSGASTDKPYAFTRGFVNSLLSQNPELGAEALEGLSHLGPEYFKDSLLSGSKSLRDIAALSPERYKLESKGLFESLQGGLGPTLTKLGELAGSGLGSVVPSLAAGLGGGAIGAGIGAMGGPPGAALGGTIGAVAGGGSASFGMNYGEVYKALKEEKVDPRLAAKYASWAAGPMAALDLAPVGVAGKMLGFGGGEVRREVARSIARRIAAGGLAAGTAEGVTEATQEAVKQGTVTLATGKPFWSIDNTEALIESGLGGFLVGGGIGATVGGFKADKTRSPPASEEDIRGILGEPQTKLTVHPTPREGGPTEPPGAGAAPIEPPPAVPPAAEHQEFSGAKRGGAAPTAAEPTAPVPAPAAEPAPVAEPPAAPPTEVAEPPPPPPGFVPDVRMEGAPSLPRRRLDDLGFYSMAERVVEEKLPNEASREQIEATLKNSGVKDEELAALEIPAWLASQQGKVSKQDLLTHIAEKAIRVQETVAEEDVTKIPSWQESKNDFDVPVLNAPEYPQWTLYDSRRAPGGSIGPRSRPWALVTPSGRLMRFETMEDAEGYMINFNRGPGDTVYRNYTLPGGSRYREVSLHLPTKEEPLPENWTEPRRGGDGRYYIYGREEGNTIADGRTPTGAIGEAFLTNPTEYAKSNNYYQRHFPDVVNNVGFIQMKDLTDVQGRRVLVGTTFQSDWGQQGRDRGFRKPGDPSPYQGWSAKKVEEHFEDRSMGPGRSRIDRWEIFNEKGESQTIHEIRVAPSYPSLTPKQALKRYLDFASEDMPVPDMPFKKAWVELLIKRFLRIAADEGYEYAAFPTAEVLFNILPNLNAKQRAGLKEFYDRILPPLIRKWARRMGSDMEKTQIESKRRSTDPLHRDPETRLRAWEPNYHHYEMPMVRITPQMATKMQQEGFPQFSLTRKHGDVIVEPLAKPHGALVDAARQAFNVILASAKQLKIDIPITLNISTMRGHNAFVTFLYDNKTDELIKANIEVSVVQNQTIDQIYAAMAHELGHIVYRTHFDNANAWTKSALTVEHERWRESLLRNPDLRMDQIIRSRDSFVMQGMMDRAFSLTRYASLSKEDQLYWLSFEEYIAEQTAAWMTTDARPLGLVEKFFWGLANKLKQAYRNFRVKFGMRGEPGEVAALWLRSIWESGNVTAYETMSRHHEKTKRANRNAFREDGTPEVEATPQTALTTPSRMALTRVEGLPAKARTVLNAAAAAADRFNFGYKWALSMPQVAARNDHITEALNYAETFRIKGMERSQIMDPAFVTLKSWRMLNRQEAQDLAKFIAAFRDGEFLSQQEKVAGVERLPTDPEMQAMAKKYNITKRSADIFARSRADIVNFLNQYKQAALAKAYEIQDPVVQARKIYEIEQEVKRLAETNFFPTMNFGQYSVTVRNAKKQVIHFETVESKTKQREAVKRLEAAAGPGETVHEGFVNQDATPFVGLPPGLLDAIANTLSLSASQRKAIDELRYDLAPVASFKYRFQRKIDTPGYSRDFMRSYANFFFHGSNYLVNVKYKKQLQDYVTAIKRSAELMPDGTDRGRIAQYFQNHLEYMMDPKPDFAFLRQLGFLWYLGFVPAAAALNLTQIVLGSYPVLAAHFGDARALRALGNAGRQVDTYYRRGTLSDLADPAKGGGASMMWALDQGVKRQVITEQLTPEIAATADGYISQAGFHTGFAQGRGWDAWQWIMERSAKMFELTEQMNRRITFRAAFDLALKNPNAKYVTEAIRKHEATYQQLSGERNATEAAAFVTAMQATYDTQFEYQQFAHPRFMRGHFRNVFMFKSFLQNTLFMLWNQPKAAIRTFLMMAFIGGLMGLPGAEDLKSLIKLIGYKLLGKDWDVEDDVRKFIIETTDGKLPPDLILHGMSRYGFNVASVLAAYGNPGQPRAAGDIDMSRAISLGRILPVDPWNLLGPHPPGQEQRALTTGLQQASGAIYGFPFSVYKFLEGGWKDFPKGWERIAPREMASVSRSMRAFFEGRERDSRGNTVINYDRTDPWHMYEMLALAGGFQPARLTAKWDATIAKIEYEGLWTVRRNGLLTQAWQTREDPAAFEKVKDAIHKFNEDIKETPARRMAITGETLYRSFQSRRQANVARESGTGRTPAQRDIAEHIRNLYPEAEVDVRPAR